MIYVINRTLSVSKLLSKCTEHKYSVYGNCFCPFHDNEDTPAAKIYAGPKGESLFCFSEGKTYRAHDVIRTFYGTPTVKIFNKVWGKLNDKSKNTLKAEFGMGYQDEDPVWDNVVKISEDFKKGKLTYKELLIKIEKEIMKYGNL